MANEVEKRITAKMVLDSTGFNSNLKGINNQLKLTQAELKSASSEVGLFGKNSEKLKGVQEALAKQIELHAKKVDVFKDSIEKNTSKMNDNIKERDKLKSSLENANRSYEEAIKLYGKESSEAQKARSQVDELTEEYKKKEKAVENNAKQITNYETQLSKANAELNRAKIELNNVNDELSKSNNRWLSASETLRNSSEKLKKVGKSISNTGDKLLKISAPLIGAGAASLKFATDFEDSMAKVSTISDESEVSIGDLRKQILKLSSDTGIASTEIANNVYDAISAGQKTGESLNFVAASTKLAKSGFTEASDSLHILTTILNAYKMKSQEVVNVSDLLIQVQNKGKVTVGELSSVMGKVIPTAVSTNTSLQQLGAGYAIMTSNGIKAAESTTYLNSMINELSKTGTDADKALRKMTGKSFNDLMEQGKSLSDVLVILDKYANKNKLSLKDMFGSAEAGKAALVLSTNAGKEFNEMLKDMNNVAGETDKAFGKVTNTTGERLKKSLNQLKNEAIRFGDAVSPILEKGTELLGKLADKLGQMDAEQLKSIANIGLFTVGLGGVLKIGGGAVSTVGNIAGGLSKLIGALGVASKATSAVGTASAVAGGAGGFGALATGLGGAVVAAAPWLLAGAAIVGTGYAIAKTLSQETVPAVDLFADKIEYTANKTTDEFGNMTTGLETNTVKISEATKNAVGAYIKMDDGVTKTLLDMYLKSEKITDDTKNLLVKKYDEMGNAIKVGIDKSYEDNYKTMVDFFDKSYALTRDSEAQILDNMKTSNDAKKQVVEMAEKQIQDILDKAAKERRELKESELNEINFIQERMKENAIKTLSESEIEGKVILERLKGYNKRITTEQASDTIKNANEATDKAIKAANDQHDKTVATIIKMRDETCSISADQADKLIQEAERQKTDSIKKAEEMQQGIVNKLKEKTPEIEDEVNLQTGKIRTAWDKIKDWWNNLWFGKKTMEVETKYTASGKPSSYITGNNSYTGGSGYGAIQQNARGTNYFSGGLTTLHERGYEVYQLPRGTRIYSHEASEDLALKTAQQVAKSVLSSIDIKSSGIGEIIVPVYLDGRKIAEASSPYADKIQGANLNCAGRGQGIR